MKILRKQYQLIELKNNYDDAIEKYAVKYKDTEAVADYLAEQHVNGYHLDDWIRSTDTPSEDYKIISFKYFREIS